MNDQILVKKCQNHEPLAQRQLFDRYYGYVYTIAYRYLQNHHDCQDVVSEMFNRIFRNISRLVDASNDGLKKWIQTIAINESLRFLQKKRPILYTDDNEILDQVVFEETIDNNYNADILKELISQMPEGYRRIFLLHVVEGLTHAEIAEYLSISRNTSKSQMLKARKYLQTQLKKYESQEF